MKIVGFVQQNFRKPEMDDTTKAVVQKIPLLTVNAGPRDTTNWEKRLNEEYIALIKVHTIQIRYFTYAVRSNQQRSR